MVQAQLPNSLKRILKINLILMIIGTFAVVVLGTALVKTENDNKKIMKFLEIAKNTHVNFEDSLVVYTEKTRNIIDYLSKLRPSNEAEFVNFISEIEKIEQNLELNMKLETIQESPTDNKKMKSKEKEDVIIYNISFFGSSTDLQNFLSKLENLPCFIKIYNINFKNLNYAEQSDNTPPNVNITIKLYIKSNGSKNI